MNFRVGRLGAVLLITSLTGCTLISPAPPEEIVAERAYQRLELLRQGEPEASHEYMAPGYRATSTLVQYRLAYGGAGMWKAIDIRDVTCNGEPPNRCEVKLDITYDAPRLGLEMPRLFKEVWIRTGGDWYKFEE
jgi:hypothetical protein